MLSPEDNDFLTQVNGGTPMGELLRRYWHPVAAVAELDDRALKPIRLFGESLVLYKDKSGSYGLLDRRCPHRGFDLSYGMVEERGLRCSYHGWRFDRCGSCLEQPFEDTVRPDSTFKEKTRIKAYPVRARSGLLWAYMGPAPAPPLPNWEPFTWPNGLVHVFFAEVPCNWFQCQENSIDPVHFEWLHLRWLQEQYGSEEQPPRHLKLRFQEFEYGFQYGRVVEGQSEEDEAWTIGRVCLWPNALYTGLNFSWRVPIDHTRTLAVDWSYSPVPQEKVPFTQSRIPYSHLQLTSDEGQWLVGDVVHQDLTALVAQGKVADRTREHLGESDRGILMMRKKFFQQARGLVNGGQVFAAAGHEDPIPLPFMGRDYLLQHQPRRASGYDQVQRSSIAEHIISGLSPETLEMWTEVFGEPPPFHHEV